MSDKAQLGSLTDLRMQEVSYELKTFEPHQSSIIKPKVALYFYYILEGQLLVSSEQEEIQAGPQDIVLAGGFLPHVISSADSDVRVLIGSEPYEHVAWLRMKPQLSLFSHSFKHPFKRRIYVLLELICDEISDPNLPPDQLTLERIAELLVFYTIRMANPITGKLEALPWSDKRILAAVTAMQQQPAYDWRVEELAKIANMSLSAFSDRFSANMGISPIKMLAEIRIKQAARKLLQGMSIAEVAL